MGQENDLRKTDYDFLGLGTELGYQNATSVESYFFYSLEAQTA